MKALQLALLLETADKDARDVQNTVRGDSSELCSKTCKPDIARVYTIYEYLHEKKLKNT